MPLTQVHPYLRLGVSSFSGHSRTLYFSNFTRLHIQISPMSCLHKTIPIIRHRSSHGLKSQACLKQARYYLELHSELFQFCYDLIILSLYRVILVILLEKIVIQLFEKMRCFVLGLFSILSCYLLVLFHCCYNILIIT